MSTFDLRFRIESPNQQKAVALRDRIGELLRDDGLTVISEDVAQQSRIFFVITDAPGELAQVEVEALDEKDAIKHVKGKGTQVLAISETPMAPAGDG